MRSEDVFELLQQLDQNGIRYGLMAGWGVDALPGEQTRLHADAAILNEMAA